MKKIKVTIEPITNMFTYGNKRCEFRLTELKSLMRTIFREFIEFESLDVMKKEEDKLFGKLNGKAPVSFKAKKVPSNGKLKTVYHKGWKDDGIEKNKEIQFEMFSRDEEKLEIYCKLLILSAIFGSIGSRARKGLGSFKIVEFGEDVDSNINKILTKNPFEIIEDLRDDFEIRDFEIRDFEIEENQKINFYDYSNDKGLNFPYVKEIEVIELTENISDDLLTKISKLTHKKVETIEKDNRKTEPFKEDIEKSWFIDNNILGNHRTGRADIKRFSSPVCISFWENNQNKYMIVKILNYEYFLLELYLSRKRNHLKKEEKYKQANQEKLKKQMTDAMIKKETLKFIENNTSEVKNFKQAHKDYVTKYLKEISKTGGGKWQSYSE